MEPQKRKSKKPNGIQLIIVGVIVAVFIIYVQLTTNPTNQTISIESEEEVDPIPDEPEIEDSSEEEDVITPQYQMVDSEEELISRIDTMAAPGFEKAVELGMVQNVDHRVSFEDGDNTFEVEYIWYTSEGINIIFSTLYKEDEEGYHAHFHPNKQGISNKYGSAPVIYDNKFYTLVGLEPMTDNNGELVEQVDDTYTFDISLISRNREHKLKDQEIPLIFNKDQEDEYANDQSINKVIYEDDEMTFTLEEVRSRLYGNQLILDYESNVDQVFGISGEVLSDTSSSTYFEFDEAPFDIDILNLDGYSGEVELGLSEIILISDDEIEFTINTDEFIDQGRQAVDEIVAEKNGIEYKLNNVTERGREYFIEMDMSFEQHVDQDFFYNQLQDHNGQFNKVSITDESGNTISSQIMNGFVINKNTFENTDQIHVKIENLMYPKIVGEKTTFDLDLTKGE